MKNTGVRHGAMLREKKIHTKRYKWNYVKWVLLTAAVLTGFPCRNVSPFPLFITMLRFAHFAQKNASSNTKDQTSSQGENNSYSLKQRCGLGEGDCFHSLEKQLKNEKIWPNLLPSPVGSNEQHLISSVKPSTSHSPWDIRAGVHRLVKGGRGLVCDTDTYQSMTLVLCPAQDLLQTTLNVPTFIILQLKKK